MPRKKILWLCSWYPSKLEPFNGDFIQRHAQAASLYNDIYVIHLIGDSSGKIKKTEKEFNKLPGLTEHIVYYRKSGSLIGKLMSNYRWLLLFRQAIRRSMIENGKPNLVHVHIPYKSGIFGIWIKRRYKIPYIVSEHWGIYNEIEKDNYISKPITFKRVISRVISRAVKFISVSKYLGDAVNNLVIKKEFQVIPNTVDTNLFFYSEKPNSVFRFIHVSNMVPLKNAKGILDAFSLFYSGNENSELVMVGDTDPSIRLYANELGILNKTVSFLGEISYQQVAKEMQRSDCLVLFSNIENSPCVIGEALCCGLPVIVTKVGGIPELVSSENAIMVEPNNTESLAKAMEEMMKNYMEYNRKKIAENAFNKFSYAVIGKQLDDVYSTFIS